MPALCLVGRRISGSCQYCCCCRSVTGKIYWNIFLYLAGYKNKIDSHAFRDDLEESFGVALLGGIGFTVSLFIANLSFGVDYPVLLNQAKFGVLTGTVLSGLLGYVVLRISL